MPRTCVENYGMIPWGAWLDAMPEIESDALCCITNTDMVIQRDFSDQELKRFQGYDDRTIGMGVNAGPDDTLADEAERIGLARDEIAYPGNWPAIPLYNCGVMIARAGLFCELRRAYDRAAEAFYQRTAHRARCQWLIGYLVHRLGMKVDLLGPEVHTHGHFGLPAGCWMEGGVCRYGDQVVMFRHHL